MLICFRSFYHEHHIWFWLLKEDENDNVCSPKFDMQDYSSNSHTTILSCLYNGIIKHFRTHNQIFVRSALEPSSLSRAVYPLLASYDTPDKQAFPRHSLSRAALITSGSPIFFLDAFTTLIVFYSSTADAALPFPPPQDCKWLFVNLLLSTEQLSF